MIYTISVEIFVVKNFVDKIFIYHAWSRQNPEPYGIVPSVRETNNIDLIHLQSQ